MGRYTLVKRIYNGPSGMATLNDTWEVIMPDHIDHPVHYTQGIECIDYIESHKMDYLEGNIIKYVTRYKFKGGVDDLRKAEWYLKKLLKREALAPLPEPPENSWPSREECSMPLTLDDLSLQLADLERETHDEVVRETAEAMAEAGDGYYLGDYRRPGTFKKPWINE